MWLLAQTIQPTDALDWAERAKHLGFAGLCLLVGIVGLIVAYWQVRLRLESEKDKAELEKSYRQDLEARARQALADTDRRLADVKHEAEKHANKHEELLRERMAAEKESDATLAHAVRVIEANTKILERVDRRLEKLED